MLVILKEMFTKCCWFVVIPGPSAPEIIQRFTAEVQPKINAVRESQLSEYLRLLPVKLILP